MAWPPRQSGHGEAVKLYVVRGDSMESSFRDGDQLVVDSRAYRRSSPRRGDVVVVRDPRQPERDELKRIVGLAGEEVRLEDGLLYVDGAVLDEPYLAGLPSTLGLESRCWRIGPDEYFVMGDDRVRSTDSREYGPVKSDLLVGRAWLRYWPPRRWGAVRRTTSRADGPG